MSGGIWSESRAISIDMLKQFFMSRITDASVSGYGESASGTAVSDAFRVVPECRPRFFESICDRDRAAAFLEAYALVERQANTYV